MKILAIRGKNLASLKGDFEVNFRSEPLRSAGLYAITGSTGSGKSTILDTMCIALYENTPRLDSINDSKTIETHGEAKVLENSTKTILSKGCHSGYAEVEFLAVDGNEYRVRVTYSRAGDRADGNFRKTGYDIFNLVDGTHKSLGATEYKNYVPALVGLKYEEFTRAVLLSQGNFAAFLKASEKEKAAILQKLTGTEIYRRISSTIYRRYCSARQELEIVQAKMEGISLLGEEELAALEGSLKELETENKENEQRLARLSAEKQWIESSIRLGRELAEAQKKHEDAMALMEQSRPTSERLKRIESVQDIRDTYMQRASLATEYKTNEGKLAELDRNLVSAKKVLEEAKLQVKEAGKLVEKAQAESEELKPKINEAIKIEEQIKGLVTQLHENSELKRRTRNEKEKIEVSIADDRKTLKRIKLEAEEIEGWFNEHERYRAIIPEIPVILSDIRSIKETHSLAASHNKALDDTKAMLADCENQLAGAKAKEEELAGTLSKEIAELRGRLIEGEPCPVCGSRHHELTSGTQKTLAETELEKARECIKKSIEQLTQSIEGHKSNITRLQSSIGIFEKNIESLTAKCMKLLGGVARGEDYPLNDDTAKALAGLARDWEKKNIRLAEIKEETSVKENGLALSEKRAGELDKELEERTTAIVSINEKANDSKERLTTLLGKWNSREEAERYLGKVVAEANEAFTAAGEKEIAATSRYNLLKGGIEEKKKLVELQKKSLGELSLRIDGYLAQRTDGLTIDELEGLLAQCSRMNEMRREVEEAKKALLKATTTLNERKRSIEEHDKAETKPQEGKSIESVEVETREALSNRSMIAERRSTINATLLKNKEDNEKYNKFREELKSKQETADDWKALDSVLGSADGNKLTRLTQGYTLDILLEVANMHLKEFSGRYILSRISQDSLGIKVIDLEMMSDTRSVHTLSGGETFLASLALSLALSSVSSNKMNIESLFIDEGFGALDSDTLKEAIDVLEKLQGTGRKIGVISHLSDMLQRIPTRIKVVKTGNGKSMIITE